MQSPFQPLSLSAPVAAPRRSRRFVAVLAAFFAIVVHALTLGAALASAQEPQDGLVGHKIKKTVVPGTELCFDTAQPCTAENRQVSVHLWYPADQGQPPGGPNAQYKSQLHDAPLAGTRFLPLSWKLAGDSRAKAPRSIRTVGRSR